MAPETHITHTKPAIFKRFLHKCGLIDLHTRVNCWFCNQDSYILPGTKDTANYWYCNLCENYNKRDQFGQIVDPSSLEVEKRSRDTIRATQPRPPAPAPTKSIKTSRGRDLCETCQSTQMFIYNAMSEYIPDESDPLYGERCATADEEKERLHKTHRLCADCQILIVQVVKEQIEQLRFRLHIRNAQESLKVEGTPASPTLVEYYSKGFLWYFTHVFTLFFIIYCTIIPPEGTILDWLTKDYIYESYKELEYLVFFAWRQDDFSWFFIIDYTINLLTSFFNSFWNNAICVFRRDYLACEWNINDKLLSVISFNLLSLYSLKWHPKFKRLFNAAKVKNLDVYEKLQWFLFGYRLFLVYLVTKISNTHIILIFGIIYITLVLSSVVLVKLPEIVGLYRTVGSQMVEEEEDEMNFSQQQEREDIVMEDVPAVDPMEIDSVVDRINQIRVL